MSLQINLKLFSCLHIMCIQIKIYFIFMMMVSHDIIPLDLAFYPVKQKKPYIHQWDKGRLIVVPPYVRKSLARFTSKRY